MNVPTPARSKPDFALPLSHLAFQRANKVIRGGVNSPARAFGAVGGEPPFIARAQGAYLYDVGALLVQAGSAATTLGTPNGPGVTAGAVQDAIVCPFNDVQAVAEAFTRFAGHRRHRRNGRAC